MDTAHLQAFLRIAETGSISRAAESLGITQPSLSQQLLRLEDEIGTRLFDRTARGVTLTDAGRVFQERARQVLHAADQAIADARNLRDDAQGHVVFAMPPSVAQMVGAALIKELAATAPLIQVRVVEAFSGVVRGWMEAEKIDLGIIYDTGPLRHLMSSRLATDELVLVGGRDRLGDPVALMASDLAGETLIVPGRQHGLRQLLDAHAMRHPIEWGAVHEADSLATIIDLVAGGFGVSVLPHCAVLDQRWAGQLTLAGVPGGGLWRSLNLVRNPAHVLTHASVRVGNLTRTIMARLVEKGAWQASIEKD